jgi:phosphopentomutase
VLAAEALDAAVPGSVPGGPPPPLRDENRPCLQGSHGVTPGKRAFVVVLDACGVGALPDAVDYGDSGTNTLVHLAHAAGGLDVPTLGRLGLGSIVPIEGVPAAAEPVLHGRLHPLGPGKDSTAGHWELMGVVAGSAPPTYPDGFPVEVIDVVGAVSGRGVVCNRPYNGIEAIEDFGARHVATGALIVYTSQDSVLQIAAHIDVMPPEQLYGVCLRVRELMMGEHAIGRVIARPFTGAQGRFERTDGRRDFSLPPPARSYLQELQADAIEVHAVGKVGELFAGVGIDVQHPGATNARAIAQTTDLLESLPRGFVFTNLIETDQVYGHRHDIEGFHDALREIDAALAGWLGLLGGDDMLILTADHGCDPTSPRTDHTREYAPLLAVADGLGSRRHDGPLADVGASVVKWLAGRDAPGLPGDPFV